MTKTVIDWWADKYGLQEDDPLYGAVLAVRESQKAAAQAAAILQEIRKAIEQIPAAAEQSPKIISTIRTLSSDVETLTRESKKLLSEQKSLVETYDWKTDSLLNSVRLQEPREREERIQAIAKSVMARVDKNLLSNQTLENWRFWLTVAGFVVVFIVGGLLNFYHLQGEGRVLDPGWRIEVCHRTAHGRAVCDLIPRKKNL